MGTRNCKGRAFWGQTKRKKREGGIKAASPTPRIPLCLGRNLGDWFLREEEKAEWALTLLGLWGLGGVPRALPPRVT